MKRIALFFAHFYSFPKNVLIKIISGTTLINLHFRSFVFFFLIYFIINSHQNFCKKFYLNCEAMILKLRVVSIIELFFLNQNKILKKIYILNLIKYMVLSHLVTEGIFLLFLKFKSKNIDFWT